MLISVNTRRCLHGFVHVIRCAVLQCAEAKEQRLRSRSGEVRPIENAASRPDQNYLSEIYARANNTNIRKNATLGWKADPKCPREL